MIYLASPYTSKARTSEERWATMTRRYDQVVQAAAAMLKAGYYVYSPIAHCHVMAMRHDMPKDFEFWRDWDIHMIDRADEVWVLKLEGWEMSYGMSEEIKHARATDKPVKYIEPWEWIK